MARLAQGFAPETERERRFLTALEELAEHALSARKEYGNSTVRTPVFRYGYLCRLIDDSELYVVAEENRSAVRARHLRFYWQALKHLSRDAHKVRKHNRERMAATRWDFRKLVSDDLQHRKLLAILLFAGIMHRIHLGIGVDSAKEACHQFEAMLSACAPAARSLA